MSILNSVLGSNIDHLDQAMTAASKRQTLLMENLANVNVPGYKRKDMSMDISFADALGSATQSAGVVSGSGLSLSPSDELSQDSNASSIRQDGNNVDLEKEVMSIAETQLRYQTLSTAVTKSFSDLKTAIGN